MSYRTRATHVIVCDKCGDEKTAPTGDQTDWDAHCFRKGWWLGNPGGAHPFHYCPTCAHRRIEEK